MMSDRPTSRFYAQNPREEHGTRKCQAVPPSEVLFGVKIRYTKGSFANRFEVMQCFGFRRGEDDAIGCLCIAANRHGSIISAF